MNYRKLGGTDLLTSPIVYGCMGGAGAFGEQDERDSIEALCEAFNQGINFFDSAEAYGNGYSEQLLSKALKDHRNDIVVLSKAGVGNLSKDKIVSACEGSLKNLNSDYIDIYLMHWPNREVPFEESIDALQKLKREGKIRYYGVSNFGVGDLSEILSIDNSICVDELAYNLFFRAIEFETLPLCKANDIPVLCYSSLMQGLLAGKYHSIAEFPENRARTKMFDRRKHSQCRHNEDGQEILGEELLHNLWEIVESTGLTMEELAVGWLKKQSGVGGVIVGTRNKKQSTDLRKLIDIDLDDSIVEKLSDISCNLKNALGPCIDMWDYRTR